MKKILITGSSGFIGGFLVDEGLRLGYKIYAGVRKSSNRKYLSDPRISFLELDLDNPLSLKAQLEEHIHLHGKFHYIIHNAGVTKVSKKDEFHKVNCINTKHFVYILIDNDWVPEKFIFISSLAAFGAGKKGTHEPIKLSDEPKPINLYGKSKLAAEKYIESKTDFPFIFIRPTGVYGPREKDYFVFFQMINKGFEGYIGYGKQYLTFIYVKDLVRTIYLAMESDFIRKAWFVSDGKFYNSKAFSEISKKVLNKKTIRLTLPKTAVKSIAYLNEKMGAVFGRYPTLNMDKYHLLAADNWNCDIKPLQNDLGFTAEYDLKLGVQEVINWYKYECWL